jgi:methylenetetrahydrofolate dehydrogenase (NADP+)/methenyltetrahydrofolate cyclohydrolase
MAPTENQPKIIAGKAFADGLRARIGEAVQTIRASNGVTPGLATVLVGEDPASQIYVRNKGRATAKLGMESFQHNLPETTSQADLLSLVEKLNKDPAVHGILVQIPLPDHIDPMSVVRAIDPAKDVDGLHPMNAGLLSHGLPSLVPCTPQGCLMLLKDALGDLNGMDAVVIGRSILVGKPIARLLTNENCTVTTAHSRTKDLAGKCRAADIVIAAAGQPHLIRGDWIKPGACVIDVGIHRIDDGGEKPKIIGDVCFEEAVAHAGAITPVPGGVGPMTIACLLRNTVQAACEANGIPTPPM